MNKFLIKNSSFFFKCLIIGLLTSLALYFIMFNIFDESTDYYICTKVLDYQLDFFSNQINYKYTNSCDEESYFLPLESLGTIYEIKDFQYQNRPIFLVLAWLVHKFLSLLFYFFNLNQILLYQLTYFMLQNLILTITVLLFNNIFNIKNTTLNYFYTYLLLLISPIYKWTIFEAGHHTQTGLLILFAIYTYKNRYIFKYNFLPILIGILYLSHRSFIVLFLYLLLILLYEHRNNLLVQFRKILYFIIAFLFPIISYQIFKNIVSAMEDHNIEVYKQFFWVFDYIRGIETKGVTGWYCQTIPSNFKCYLLDTVNVLKYLYIPAGIVFLYILLNKNFYLKNKEQLNSLIHITFLVSLFWSFIGWYPPVRFSFYSSGHFLIIISILIFYNMSTKYGKLAYFSGYFLFFILHNHYNGEIYFPSKSIYLFSLIFYLIAIFYEKKVSVK